VSSAPRRSTPIRSTGEYTSRQAGVTYWTGLSEDIIRQVIVVIAATEHNAAGRRGLADPTSPTNWTCRERQVPEARQTAVASNVADRPFVLVRARPVLPPSCERDGRQERVGARTAMEAKSRRPVTTPSECAIAAGRRTMVACPTPVRTTAMAATLECEGGGRTRYCRDEHECGRQVLDSSFHHLKLRVGCGLSGDVRKFG